jgi:hypothetical protein
VHPLTGQEAEKTVGELMTVPASVAAEAKPIYE